jgi:hypothetical protein
LEVSGVAMKLPESGQVGFPGACESEDKRVLLNINGAKKYKIAGLTRYGGVRSRVWMTNT